MGMLGAALGTALAAELGKFAEALAICVWLGICAVAAAGEEKFPEERSFNWDIGRLQYFDYHKQ